MREFVTFTEDGTPMSGPDWSNFVDVREDPDPARAAQIRDNVVGSIGHDIGFHIAAKKRPTYPAMPVHALHEIADQFAAVARPPFERFAKMRFLDALLDGYDSGQSVGAVFEQREGTNI